MPSEKRRNGANTVPDESFQLRKLIIQIPCFNEEDTLSVTLGQLPRHVDGYDVVEWLIIDDGSTDNTVAVAKQHGADHVVRLGKNRGLATAFLVGLDSSLKLGAHTIVNTDADNQYRSDYIPALVKPILTGKAQIVVGARPIHEIDEFSFIKRRLQLLGSLVVRIVSNTDIPDAPSGFRAIHRDAAVQLNVFNDYTYTLETIIQAGHKGIPITWVPIEVNDSMRPSRLISSTPKYIWRSMVTIVRIFIIYKPTRFFGIISLIPLIPALFAILRFLYFYINDYNGHVQSLVLATALLMIAVVTVIFGILAELIAANRRLLEDIRVKVRLQELAETRLNATGKNPPLD